MLVWDQTPPSDVDIFVRRNTLRQPGLFRLPEPLARQPRWILPSTSPAPSPSKSHAGEFIQIIDIAGRAMLGFSGLPPPRARSRRGPRPGRDNHAHHDRPILSEARLHSKFFDADRIAMVEMIQDSVGRHDTFNLACTARYYEDMGYFGHPNCSENFNQAPGPLRNRLAARLARDQFLLQHQCRRA